MTHLSEEGEKQNRLEMIREALQEKAPFTYEKLEKSGKLQKFLEERDADMMKSYSEAKDKAWEETLSTFLDFFDPSYDETSSPM
jgi:hypothetical protein